MKVIIWNDRKGINEYKTYAVCVFNSCDGVKIDKNYSKYVYGWLNKIILTKKPVFWSTLDGTRNG